MSCNYTGLFNTENSSGSSGGSSTSTASLVITGTTQSTTTGNGALIVAGGVGIAKNLNIGGLIDITGDVYMDGAMLITKPSATNLFMDSNPTSIGVGAVQNTGYGEDALFAINDGQFNTAMGYRSCYNIVSAIGCTAVGRDSLLSNQNGNSVTAVGSGAGFNCIASDNTLIGAQAGAFIDTGTNNTIVGSGTAGSVITTGNNNTLIGFDCQVDSLNASNRIGIGSGVNVLNDNSCIIGNSSVNNLTLGAGITMSKGSGVASFRIGDTSNTLPGSGASNICIGRSTGDKLDTGNQNTFFGDASGAQVDTGSNNSCFGQAAGISITDEGQNVCIGVGSDITAGNSNSVALGTQAVTTKSNQLLVGNITEWAPGGNGNCNLGSATNRFDTLYATNGTINTSDRNSKELIENTKLGLDFINDLKPVQYKLKDYTQDFKNVDGSTQTRKITYKRLHHGLISQEVKESLDKFGVSSNDFAGYIDTESGLGLRYTEFIAPMIKAIQELSDEVKLLKSQLEK